MSNSRNREDRSSDRGKRSPSWEGGLSSLMGAVAGILSPDRRNDEPMLHGTAGDVHASRHGGKRIIAGNVSSFCDFFVFSPPSDLSSFLCLCLSRPRDFCFVLFCIPFHIYFFFFFFVVLPWLTQRAPQYTHTCAAPRESLPGPARAATVDRGGRRGVV
jgi:hypothetical protein